MLVLNVYLASQFLLAATNKRLSSPAPAPAPAAVAAASSLWMRPISDWVRPIRDRTYPMILIGPTKVHFLLLVSGMLRKSSNSIREM